MINCAFICPPTLIVFVEEAPPELGELLQKRWPEGEFIPITCPKYRAELERWADYVQDTETEFTWEDVPGELSVHAEWTGVGS